MSNSWQHIRELLHEHEDSIDLLTTKDGGFRELCVDFDDCVDALRRWCGSREPGAGARADEYRSILASLLEEIRQNLENRPQIPS